MQFRNRPGAISDNDTFKYKISYPIKGVRSASIQTTHNHGNYIFMVRAAL